MKCLKFSKSQTGSYVSVQLASQFQSFVISLYLSICGFSVPSINCNYLCQMSIKQWCQYVCRIWRKTWINVNDFSKSCDQVQWQNGDEGWSLYFTWLPMFLRRPVCWDCHWCKDDVCRCAMSTYIFFHNAYVVFIRVHIKIVHLFFYSCMFRSSHVQFTPKATGNGYWNMQIVIIKKENV
jgi:hypothetical protein